MKRDVLAPLALGACIGLFIAGLLASALTLCDCYEGDPGYGLCTPDDEPCLARVDAGDVAAQ